LSFNIAGAGQQMTKEENDMKRYGWIVIAVVLLVFLTPARLPAPNSTRMGVGNGEGIVDRDLGVRVDWDNCNCRVSATEFTIAEGQSLPARITLPAKLASRGIAGTKAGDEVSLTYQGGDKWLVRHGPSGKTCTWRWNVGTRRRP
jgi:hypothetical protein